MKTGDIVMLTITNYTIIGVEAVDKQHQELVNMINEFSSKDVKRIPKEETKSTLEFLGIYIKKHFADEETLQKECNYPDYEKHKQLHRQFILDFTRFCKMFYINGPSPMFTQMLNNLVINWVEKHINGADAEFGKYYNENKER